MLITVALVIFAFGKFYSLSQVIFSLTGKLYFADAKFYSTTASFIFAYCKSCG